MNDLQEYVEMNGWRVIGNDRQWAEMAAEWIFNEYNNGKPFACHDVGECLVGSMAAPAILWGRGNTFADACANAQARIHSLENFGSVHEDAKRVTARPNV